jgi:hypothetical protein
MNSVAKFSTHPSDPVWETLGDDHVPSARLPAHPAFQRLIGRLPSNLLSTFSPEQLRYLAIATLPAPSPHIVEYRASIWFFGKRFYLTVYLGRERRKLERLYAEGQLAARRLTIAYSVMATIASVLLTAFTVLGLYVMKSGMNIDLFDGPSPLHAWFYSTDTLGTGFDSGDTGMDPGTQVDDANGSGG